MENTSKLSLRKKFIGSKAFYSMVFAVVVPMIIQNGVTNFVSLLDNIMVGRVGTEQMSGVAIVNQLFFVFYLCIFGGLAGAGIFTAQYFGSKDTDGVRYTFRFKWITAIVLMVVAGVVFLAFGKDLILLFLHEGSEGGDLQATLEYARQYMDVALIGIIPFAVSQVYSSTLRELGETMLPMKASVVAVLVNVVLNYILIFGHFGAPKMGIVGAAIATNIARVAEMLIIIIWTHTHKVQNPFIVGAYRSLHIPMALVRQIITKGMLLMVNEALWSVGVTIMTQSYSLRGLAVIAGLNIASTVNNIFNVVYMSIGNSVGIIVGRLLGAGEMEEAKDTDNKLIAFAVLSCVVVGTIMAIAAPFFPMIYNTTEEVRHLATSFIFVSAVCMPVNAFLHSCYFTLRSGGKTLITFIFDSGFMWAVSIPVAFVLSRFTTLHIIPLYCLCVGVELIKAIIGYILVKKNTWLHNMVS